MSNKTMVKFYAGNGQPLVKPVRLMKGEEVIHEFKTRNQYKAFRKALKAERKKERKAV